MPLNEQIEYLNQLEWLVKGWAHTHTHTPNFCLCCIASCVFAVPIEMTVENIYTHIADGLSISLHICWDKELVVVAPVLYFTSKCEYPIFILFQPPRCNIIKANKIAHWLCVCKIERWEWGRVRCVSMWWAWQNGCNQKMKNYRLGRAFVCLWRVIVS